MRGVYQGWYRMFFLSKILGSCASLPKAKEPRKPQFWAFWDLDGTIFNIPQSTEEYAIFKQMPHLTEIITLEGISVFMIYLEETREAIKQLIELKVNVAFITHGEYDESILEFLEYVWDIADGTLKDAIFINRLIFRQIYLKGEKLTVFKRKGMIAKEDFVLLIDNQDDHIDNVMACGFAGIIAEGWHQKRDEQGNIFTCTPNNGYLLQAVDMLKRKIQQATSQLCTENPEFTVQRASFTVVDGQIVARPDMVF